MTDFDAEEILNTARDAFVGMDAHGVIVAWNRAAEAMFGYSAAEAVGRALSPLIVPERYRAAHDAGVARFLETREPTVIGEHRVHEALRRSGEEFAAEITHWATDSDDGISFYAFIRDVTERRAQQAELARARARTAELTHRTLHDELTGLPNRTLAIDRIEQALATRPRSDGQGIAILFVDLDRFKLVNDSLGHEAGDQLLREMGWRLRGAVRPSDTVARVAGDEFVVVCPELPEPELAEEIARRIRSSLDMPVHLASQLVHLSASVGVAFARPDHGSADDLIRDADAAMYRAKERGGGRIAVFDDSMHERLRNRLQLESELDGCAERGELRMRYRPIAECGTGRIAGVQLLNFWQHPRYGLLQPDQFLPVADETGLVIPISTWSLREGFAQFKTWQQDYPELFLMANCSYRDMTQTYFLDTLGELLDESGLDPASILIGIIVPPLAEEDLPDSLPAMIRRISDTGVRIMLNHFGAHESAMPLLRTLAPQAARVDRSLAAGIERSGRERAIVKHLIAMAKDLGLEVIVDGVATVAQGEAAAELGCDYAEGAHIGDVLPAAVMFDRLGSLSALA